MGAAAGDWETKGTVRFLGQEIPRVALVFAGKVKAVYYNGTTEIQADDLVFGISLQDFAADYGAIDIPETVQAEVDRILESFKRIPTLVPTPTAPTSELFPDATYALAKELVIGIYAVRLWRNTASEGLGFDSIVTISAVGQPQVKIESAPGWDDLTGTDITGEGDPDVIIETYSGGAHCCFATFVYNLGSKLTKVLETPSSNCGGIFQDLDEDGVLEFVTCDDLFAYTYCPFVGSPAVKVILRYEPGRGYVPASPRFAHLYADDIATHTQMAEQAEPGAMGEWDGTTKCSVLPLVLDYLYSGQPDQAWAALKRWYSHPDLESFRAEIEEAVNQSPLFTAP
jgi:hypothetical protein